MIKFYQYAKITGFHYVITERSALYNKGMLSFPSGFTSGYPFNDTVYVDVFEPLNMEKWIPIVLIHSWMENKNGATEWFARELAKRGFGAYLLHLPYHMNRAHKRYKSGSLFITTDVNRSVNAYRQAVIDIMALCDWLEDGEKIIKGQIGMVGISLGAIILNTVMGIDKRIKAGVSILGGGNLHYIFTRGIATLPIVVGEMIKGLRIRDYRNMTKDYIEYLKEVRRVNMPEEIEDICCPREWFLIDPLTYAHLNQPRNVLMINGRFDLIVPVRATIQLWEALGRPPIVWLPSTHITSTFFHKTILYHTLKYFKNYLA
ncbi:MAG: hypothetical protein N3D17_04835 [bacterium]|nr:hypothetical protein [bacterium]